MENFSKIVELQNSIVKVEKLQSTSPLRRPTWKIHMRVGTRLGIVRLTTRQLVKGPKDFDSEMFGVFSIFLPRELYIKENGANTNWENFTCWLAKNAEVIPNGRSRK